MQRARTTTLIALLVMLVGTARAAMADDFRSPEGPINPTSLTHTRKATSPDARFVVTEAILRQDDGGWTYRLDLRDRRTGRLRHLYTHHRDARFKWSPDSRRMAISDFMGSDEGDCYLVHLPAIAFSSPDERILRFIDGKRLLGGEIEHLYFDCENWKSPRSIVVHVWGDGNNPGVIGPSKGLDARVLYSLSGKMKLLSLKHD